MVVAAPKPSERLFLIFSCQNPNKSAFLRQGAVLDIFNGLCYIATFTNEPFLRISSAS